jgi:hypothetical protein
VTAPNMEAPGEVGTEGRAQGTVADIDSATALPETQAEAAERTRLADKRLSTVRAELAMKGIAAHVVEDGFLIERWGYSRHVPTIEALEAFAVQVGARAA